MKIWKARLMALLMAVAMLVVVQGPVMAQDFGDCDFVGFDSFGDAVFSCDTDFDNNNGFFDNNNDFFDEDFDGFDDRFFFDDDFVSDSDCLGAVIGNECFGIDT